MEIPNDRFEVSVNTNEDDKWASVRHVESNCGADFYESGEAIEFQCNNGLFSNCPPEIIALARKIAKGALSYEPNQKYSNEPNKS